MYPTNTKDLSDQHSLNYFLFLLFYSIRIDFSKAYRDYMAGLKEVLLKQEKLDEAEKKVKDTEEKVKILFNEPLTSNSKIDRLIKPYITNSLVPI